MKKLLFLMLMASIFSTTAFSQDIMYLRNKQVKEVQIVEIGVNEIKYKNFPPRLEEPVIVIDKLKVEKIELENGEVLTFSTDPFRDKDLYAHQNRNAIKISFISPLSGSFIFSYERSIKPGMSFETDLGIVGLGYDLAETNPSGVFFRGGVKFIRTPDYYVQGMKYAHILKGSYIKPELIFSAYSENDFDMLNGIYNDATKKRGGAFVLNLGKQVVYNDFFLVDFYGGIGYGFTNDQNVRFGFSATGNLPIAFTSGLKIGFLFK